MTPLHPWPLYIKLFTLDATGMLQKKIGSSITQELGWGSKDWDISLLQEFSKSLCSLIGGHISHDMICKVIAENQNAHHVWWLIQLDSHLNAREI